MDKIQAISAQLPLSGQQQLIIAVVSAALLYYFKPWLFIISMGALGYYLFGPNNQQTPTPPSASNKKDDDANIDIHKKASLDENEDEMKQIMKDMRKDQRKKREIKQEMQRSASKELEDEEAKKREEESRKKEERGKETRKKVVHELLETEKSYVDKLNTLVEVFEQPMRHSATVTADQINRMFSNVQSLKNFNVLLLQDLEKIMAGWRDDSLLGGVFLSMADFLKLYITYINNYSSSLETYNNCRSNPQFCTLLEACERNPRCAGLDLPSLLIMPVQRIPRYILLLTEIYKLTPPAHPDYDKLGLALAKVKEVAVHINEAKRDAESHFRLYELSKSIEHLNEPLIRPSRKLILEGDLKQKPKAASLSDQWEVVTYFLFSDVLIQAKKKGKKFSAKSTTPIQTLQLIRYENKHEFGLVIKGELLLVTGTTPEETAKWVSSILDAQKADTEHSKSFEAGSPNIKNAMRLK